MYEYMYAMLQLNSICTRSWCLIIYQTLQLTNSNVYLFIMFSSFSNQPEILYKTIQDYSSPQLFSLMIEMNLFNGDLKLLRLMD